jgi:hypothetical protein
VSARVALLLALAPALLGACGGGDSGGSDASARDEFVRTGEAICLDAQLAIEQIPQPATPRDLGAWAGKYVQIARKQVGRLRRLDAPDELAGEMDALVDTLGRSVDAVARAGAAARHDQVTRATAFLAESQALAADAQEQARTVGLDVCVPSG